MNRRDWIKAAAMAPLAAIPARAQAASTVESIEVFRIRATPRETWVIVRLKTKNGLFGIGDASHGGNDEIVIRQIKEYFERLKGNSPFQIEPLRKALASEVQQYGPPGMVAFSALEQALCDLQGRVLGIPCFALFGGMLRDKIRHYANIDPLVVKRVPEGFVQQAEFATKVGFDAVRIAPFDNMPKDPARLDALTKNGISCVAAVRKSIGPNRILIVDANGAFEVKMALDVAKELAVIGVDCLEEPTPTLAGMAEVNAAAKMPIGGGESLFAVGQAFPYLAGKFVDFVMPDVKHCGGMFELRKIAAIAEGAQVACAPHCAASPVGNIATAQVAASMANFLICEVVFGEVAWRGDLLRPSELFQQGHLILPESPGFGVQLNDPVARKYAL